jgi:NADH-quinone oxidoreductase subunit G
LCEKGCNTSAWIKAKPEWAKGARLVRVTPRLNPDVNGYWMCDIGRFDYHWIESDERLQRPLLRSDAGTLEPTDWRAALAKVADRVAAAGGPSALRLLISAHASLEELFVIGRVGGALGLPPEGVAVAWRTRPKPQPPDGKFKIPPIDAPNVRGAQDLGFPVRAGTEGEADISGFRAEVEAGRVGALYVFDPGPDGSMGDLTWMIDAKRSGMLPLLIVQGVLLTDLAKAADIVLPGATWVEKDASYANAQGLLQSAARVLPPPGDAQEDWQIFVNLGLALGASVTYSSSGEIRSALAAAMRDNPAYAGLTTLQFARPVAASHWLQASNPSERWKWDFMFQDLPPVKFAGTPAATSWFSGLPVREIR